MRRWCLLSLAALLGGCSTALPPAPTVVPVIDAPLDPVSGESRATPRRTAEAEADAEAINELTDVSAEGLPEFDPGAVSWDIDVRTYADHPRVRHYLDYFQGPARARMAVFLERSASYDPMIRRRFEAENLPGDLGYLALIESGYSSVAVSRSNAVGMWQFMKPTGKGYGLRIDGWVDERRDPVKATDAAARHLRDLRGRFGSLYLAAAAYNAGAGKVSRSLGRLQWEVTTSAFRPAESTDLEPTEAEVADDDVAPIDDFDPASDAAFFRLAETELLAAETQDYVPKLIAAALIAKEPVRYGFEQPNAEPFAYDSIVVSDATGLDVVARLAGVTTREIADLNPQYLRLATPPRSTMVVRLPAGTGAAVGTAYDELPAARRVRFITHTVRKRERLATIAARYRVTQAEIRAMNPRVRAKRLAAGTKLTIPAVSVPSALALRAAGVHADAPSRARGKAGMYRVRSGDTLTGIARRHRITLVALRRANSLSNSTTLRPGMRLRIPS